MHRQNIKSVDANIRSAHSLCDAEMQTVSETDAAATVAA